jgi:hypothetical protein
MALAYKTRYKPDINLDKAVSANVADDVSSGTVMFEVQCVQYDTASFPTGGSYVPGHPDTETKLTIVDQDVLSFELAAIAGLSAAQKTAFFKAALNAWAAQKKPQWLAIAPIRAAALAVPPQDIP